MPEEDNDNQGILRFPDLGKFARRRQDAGKPEEVRRDAPTQAAPVERSFSTEEVRFCEMRAQKAEVWAKWCRKKLENVRKDREQEESKTPRGIGTKMRKALKEKMEAAGRTGDDT